MTLFCMFCVFSQKEWEAFWACIFNGFFSRRQHALRLSLLTIFAYQLCQKPKLFNKIFQKAIFFSYTFRQYCQTESIRLGFLRCNHSTFRTDNHISVCVQCRSFLSTYNEINGICARRMFTFLSNYVHEDRHMRQTLLDFSSFSKPVRYSKLF